MSEIVWVQITRIVLAAQLLILVTSISSYRCPCEMFFEKQMYIGSKDFKEGIKPL